MKENRSKKKSIKKKKSNISKKKIFSEEHYNSKNGMSTYVWGPSAWLFLHSISFNYPDKPTQTQKKKYKKFFELLGDVLPCGMCRKNFNKNVKFKGLEIDMDIMESRETLSKWLCRLHNKINKNLLKEKYDYSDIRNIYENFRARCTKSKKVIKKNKNNKKKTVTQHGGCTIPLYGKKPKSVIRIVPKSSKMKTFIINKECMAKRE